jgi:hypothetical protein
LPVAGIIAETVVCDEEDSVASLDEENLLTTEDAAVLSDEEDAANAADADDADEDDADAEEDDAEEELDEDDEYDSDDEDERIMSMPLQDMTDAQIDRYIELSGLCPRDEIDRWSVNFRGGAILRYSYVKFTNVALEDQHVSNMTIRRAEFLGTTFRNCVFEQVHFDECDFKSVVLENVTFNNCHFTECDLDSYMSLDNSCIVENIDCEEEMRQAFLEDNVTYSFY